jgi:RNA polymerase sigma factor (sigma-70 family)
MQPRTGLSRENDAALVDLYQRHVYTLLSFIRRYVSTREDAEDVLLEVFMAAFERNALAGLSEGEQLAWLRRVAHNKCVDLYRRARRRQALSLESVSELLYEDEEHAPEEVALRAEEYALLRAHVANLPARQQEVLRLRFASNLRAAEIARRLNKRESAVHMLLARALNMLRSIYEKAEEGDCEDE